MTDRKTILPTLAEVMNHGPLTRETAAKWGLRFPLKRGWKDRLIRQILAESEHQRGDFRAHLLEKDVAYFDHLLERVAEAERLLGEAQSLLDAANLDLGHFVRTGSRG